MVATISIVNMAEFKVSSLAIEATITHLKQGTGQQYILMVRDSIGGNPICIVMALLGSTLVPSLRRSAMLAHNAYPRAIMIQSVTYLALQHHYHLVVYLTRLQPPIHSFEHSGHSKLLLL